MAIYGIRLKKNAAFSEERTKICAHEHVRYRGAIPCTGPIICTMCGYLWETMEEAKTAGRFLKALLKKGKK